MKPLLNAGEMRAFEKSAIEGWGIPSLVLQEHAAMGALDLIPSGESISVLAGPGNNGGDALALARLARLRGDVVEVWTLDPEPRWRGDAAIQAKLWEGMGGSYRCTSTPETLIPMIHGWVVDGLFGLGTRLPLPEPAKAWVKALTEVRARRTSCRILALDLPSGLDPSSGDVAEAAVPAHLTACFGALKLCHGLKPAQDFCGEIRIIPLPLPGTPAAALQQVEAPAFMQRGPWNAHKRDFGHVAIRAGSAGMGGAAVLATLGALRMGAGLVTVLVDAGIRTEVASQVPEAMVKTWEGQVPEGIDALLVGPGGVMEIPLWEGPLVLDASALRPGEGPRWMHRPWTVLTPHSGEFTRLFDLHQALCQDTAARLEHVRLVATGPGVLVLKGAQSLVGGGDDATLLVNPAGNPSLATGGTGDFLAGMMVARLAYEKRRAANQPGSKLKEAVAEVLWLHGTAADRSGSGPLLVRDLGASLSLLLKELHERP